MRSLSKALLGLSLLATPVLADITVDPNITPTAVLSCTLPIEREDGTALAINEIATINFYAGTTVGDYTDTIGMLSCSMSIDVTALTDAPYYYVVTAVDTDGRESVHSPMYTLTVKRVKPPRAPTWN